MEEKNATKISLSTFFLILAIIAIIVMGIFIYKLNNDKTTEIQKSTELQAQVDSLNSTVTNLQSKINTVSQAISDDKVHNTANAVNLDINSNQVQALYKYIMNVNDNQEELVYRTTKVTEKQLNNQLKLITIFQNLSENQADETKSAKDEYGNSSVHTYFNKAKVENMAKNIFGNDVTITHESTMIGMGENIDYKDNRYDRYDYEGGGRTPWETSTSKLIKAEQIGDEIYIYDKYVHLLEVENIVNGINHSGSYDIYSASDKNVKLSSKVDFDKNNLYGDDEIGNIEKFLNQELTTFKHTFKNASDGSYYWYSTEPIK